MGRAGKLLKVTNVVFFIRLLFLEPYMTGMHVAAFVHTVCEVLYLEYRLQNGFESVSNVSRANMHQTRKQNVHQPAHSLIHNDV